MRFCLVSTQQHWGGGEALLSGIAHELEQAGHATAWIARGASEVLEHVARTPAAILHTTRGRGFNMADWLAMRHAFRTWVPDVLLLNDTHAVPLAGSAAWFCPAPRPLRLAYKHTVFPLRSRLKYRLLTDKLVCVSHAARNTVSQGGLAASRTAVIHGGCPLPVVHSQARQRIRAELQVAADQRLLVCVGNLLPCKGHSDLLHAVRLLPRQDLRLVIAGEGEQRPTLEQLVQRLGLAGCVQLLGYRDDANDLLAAADLVVHPSHSEGLSLVLIQAQMLGKPIVATPVGGAVEVLQSDSPELCSCWLAKPNDPASLALALRTALSELDSPSSSWNARLERTTERARAEFRIEGITQQLIQLAVSLTRSCHFSETCDAKQVVAS